MSNDTTLHCIYRIVNFANGKCYIGRTNQAFRRKTEHFRHLKLNKHQNYRLQRAYNKYGAKSFFYEVLERNISDCEVNSREIYWIAHFDSFHNGYNRTTGGDTFTEFTIKANSKPCIWNGVTYKSIRDAADAAGITRSALGKMIANGYSSLEDRACGKRTCEWNGIKYRSITKCAEAIGIDRETLVKFLDAGYKCDDDVLYKVAPILCVWNGITYPSIAAAAKGTGIPETTMYKYVRRGYTSSRDINKRVTGTNKPIPCIWNGIQYSSMAEAARANNVDSETMRERVQKGYTCDTDFKLKFKHK